MEPVQQLFLSNAETQGETEAELEIHQTVRTATNPIPTPCSIKRYQRRGKDKAGVALQFAQSIYTEKEDRKQAENHLPHRQVTNNLMPRFNQLSVTFSHASTRHSEKPGPAFQVADIDEERGVADLAGQIGGVAAA